MDIAEAFMVLALAEARKNDPIHGPKNYNKCKTCGKLIFDVDTFPDGNCSECHAGKGDTN